MTYRLIPNNSHSALNPESYSNKNGPNCTEVKHHLPVITAAREVKGQIDIKDKTENPRPKPPELAKY